MSTSEGDFEQFNRFLDEWSRRDFLKRVSGTVAYAAFLAGGVELLESRAPRDVPGDCGGARSAGA